MDAEPILATVIQLVKVAPAKDAGPLKHPYCCQIQESLPYMSCNLLYSVFWRLLRHWDVGISYVGQVAGPSEAYF